MMIIPKKILSKISKDLSVEFSVAGGKIERYRDQQLGSMVLIFEQEDVERVCNYLDAKGIVWHRYTPLNIEKLQEEEEEDA